MNDIIVLIVPIVLTIGVVSLSLALFLVAIYDLITTRSRVKPNKKSLPKMTIIVMDTGNSDAMKDCLVAIKKARYRKLDTVVIGAGGHRSEPTRVRKLTKKYTHVMYYQPRKEHSHDKLIQEAYKRSERGSIVIVIDSHMSVTNATLNNIARWSDVIKSGKTIRLQPSSDDYGVAGVIMSLKGSAYRMFIKLSSLLHVRVSAAQRPNGYVLASSLVTGSQRKRLAWRYSDLGVSVAYLRLGIAARPELSKKLAGRLLGLGVITALAIVMVLAAIDGSGLEAFTVSWLLVATAAALLVLFDTHTSSRQKIETVVCFGFLPIMAVIAYATSIKYDAHPRRITAN